MPYLHRKYYGGKEIPPAGQAIYDGFDRISSHPVFGALEGEVYMKASHISPKGGLAAVDRKGNIYLNIGRMARPEEWAYCIAHCLLHLAFGHFDLDNLPNQGEGLSIGAWAKACDIYIAQFLIDTEFGGSMVPDPKERYSIKLTDEKKIYRHLLYEGDTGAVQNYGMNGTEAMDMVGLEHPVKYHPGQGNPYTATFARVLARAATKAVGEVSQEKVSTDQSTDAQCAARWFLSHYPLLGGLAAGFRLVEDVLLCQKQEIQIAAVDASAGIIYLNPASGLSEAEWRFVLGHEYLHAGLDHEGRCQGRDRYLWNIACDYVVNDWLCEMQIGQMPQVGLLYDPSLHGMSAEAIYDLIVKKMRRFKKHATFRGYGKGDIIPHGSVRFAKGQKGIRLDEFFKSALREGLDYYNEKKRGFLPAGLIEEIRALSAKPIPWDVQLGKLFTEWFPPLEKHRSYARASRRQGSTPDIPRPGYRTWDEDLESRTFGVVVDTSGSMETKQIGYALGAIASYAVAKDVGLVRVIFCDAAAYDIGYVTPEEIAGRVEVTGRGGTCLQPGIDVLEKARDFPVDAPILIITDGYIEDFLSIRHRHAYLLPKGNRLPFRTREKVFYFDQGR